MCYQDVRPHTDYGLVTTIALLTIVALLLYHFLHQPRTANDSLPLVGRKDGWLSMLLAPLRECYWPGSKSVTEGYEKFSSQGRPFLVPDISFRPHVIIPHHQCQWLISLPPSVVSSHDALRERIGLKYIIPHYTQQDLSLMKVAIRRGLTQNLNRLQEEMFNEVQKTVDAVIGVNQDWKETNLPHALEEILRRSGTRMMVGPTLSQDERFILCLRKFAKWFGVSSFVVGQLTPWPLKWMIALLFRPVVGYYHGQVAAYLDVIFDEHFKLASEGKEHLYGDLGRSTGLITSTVDAIISQGSGAKVQMYSFKSLFTTLVTIGSLSMHGSLTNTLLDLVSSNPDLGYYDALRKEAEVVFPQGMWSDESKTSGLPCAESAIRESMRLNPGSTRLLSRIVVAKEGLILPDGIHVPKNSTISLPADIQRDELFYKQGARYNALRFAFPNYSDQTRPSSLTTASDIFMSFGCGTHTCPGRFLASRLMTMVLSYITLHYNIEHLQQRPGNTLIADLNIPPQACIVRLRRRQL